MIRFLILLTLLAACGKSDSKPTCKSLADRTIALRAKGKEPADRKVIELFGPAIVDECTRSKWLEIPACVACIQQANDEYERFECDGVCPITSPPDDPNRAKPTPEELGLLTPLEIGPDETALRAWGLAAAERLLEALAGKPQPAEGPTEGSDLRNVLTAKLAHLYGKNYAMKVLSAQAEIVLSRGRESLYLAIDLWGDDQAKRRKTPVEWWQVRYGSDVDLVPWEKFPSVEDPALLATTAPFVEAVARRTLDAIAKGNDPAHALSALVWGARDDPEGLIRFDDREITPDLLAVAKAGFDGWTVSRVGLHAWYLPADPSVPYGTNMAHATVAQYFQGGKTWLGSPEPEGVWTPLDR